jgi:hypothetical protein
MRRRNLEAGSTKPREPWADSSSSCNLAVPDSSFLSSFADKGMYSHLRLG